MQTKLALHSAGYRPGRNIGSGFGPGAGPGRSARLCAVLAAAVLLMLAAQPGHAQLILMPGGTYDNIAAAGRVLANTGEGPAPPVDSASTSPGLSASTVTFNRADSLSQNILLYASVTPNFVAKSATARGILFVDFCVPVAGSTTCDAPPDPAAADVIASITFGYGVVGSVSAFGIGSKATFGASGSVIDLGRNAYVNFQKLADLSASLGTIKTIAKVPIPIPDFSQAVTTLPVTFTTLLKRGHTYRFQLAGASTAEGRAKSSAVSDFYGYATTSLQRGRVQLRNLTIQVGQDSNPTGALIEELKALVASLQGQIGNLAEQIDSLRGNVDEETAALRQELDDLAAKIDRQGSFLLLPVDSIAPEGYAFVGNFELKRSGEGHGREGKMTVAVFWKGAAESLPASPLRHGEHD